MKRLPLLLASLTVIIITGCTNNNDVNNPDIAKNEAYCATFTNDKCPQNQCEICGVSKVSSFASCHSKEFCEKAPME